MIAKLIVHAPDRDTAIMKMKWALSEFIVDGVDTNIDYQLSIIRHKAFKEGNYNNSFLENEFKHK
jgi:acetyl-CoA carboxylase biotin carboxylase subunit